MVDLRQLKTDIEALQEDRNSLFFHDLVEKTVSELKFKRTEQWYEADFSKTMTRSSEYYDLAVACSACTPKNIAFRRRYERKNDWIVSTTNHRNLVLLNQGIYVARSIMSNSNLGFDKTVIMYDKVREKFPEKDGRDSLALAFEADNIVKLDESYFLHPRFLYELLAKQK
jgi:hypothetical protein